MKKRVTIPALAAVLLLQLPFSACEKPEYVDGPGGVDTTILGEQAKVFSFSQGWGGPLDMDSDSSGWDIAESVGQVELPALEAGDRLVALLQVGLQNLGTCTQNVNLSAGMILGSNATQTPGEEGVIGFSGGFTVDTWQNGEWVRQFVRSAELTVPNGMPNAVVQAFAKPWSLDCGPVPSACTITGCNLTVIVIPNQN